MDLVERYLLAVRTFLPRKGQNDIVRELSENIRSQMEEKEEELGRPLTESEAEAIIKSHGHPIVVAARYGRAQYLIGPTMFPFYWLALKIAVAGALVVRSILAIVMAFASPDPARALIPAIIAVPWVVVPVFCWVTAAFAAFELFSPLAKLNFKGEWSLKALPTSVEHWSVIPRTESLAQILFGSVFVTWWLSLPSVPALVFGPAASILAMAPIWGTLYWPIAVFGAIGVMQAWVDFSRPTLNRGRAIVRLAIHTVWLAVLALIFGAGRWVELGPQAPQAAEYVKLVEILNLTFYFSFLIGIVVSACQLAWGCIKLFRSWMNPATFAGIPRPQTGSRP